jgi:transposase
MAPTPEQEGLRDLVRCREDLRDARTRARHRVVKQLLRRRHVYRQGKHWTQRHRAWLRTQRLADPVAHRAFEHMLCHLDAVDAQIEAIDDALEQLARSERWAPAVQVLCACRGISTRTALGLLAEIGDFRRFGSAGELMSYLGLVPSEYPSPQLGCAIPTRDLSARKLTTPDAAMRSRPAGYQRDQSSSAPHRPPRPRSATVNVSTPRTPTPPWRHARPYQPSRTTAAPSARNGPMGRLRWRPRRP